jgi:hypothetical protein
MNVVSAAKDVLVIAGKEASFNFSKASSATNNATGKLAAKAHALRENYEVNLVSRKDIVEGDIVVIRKHQDSEA